MLQVIFQTLLAAAIAAKLPSYTLPTHTLPTHTPPTLHQHHPNVGNALHVLPTRPSHQPPVQGHEGHNGLTQIHEPAETHVPLHLHGPAGQNDLTQTFTGPTRPQEPFQFQVPTEQDVFIQTFAEPAASQGQQRPQHSSDQYVLTQPLEGPTRPHESTQTFVTPTAPQDLTQTYQVSAGPYSLAQPQGTEAQDIFGGPATEPHGQTHPQGDVGSVLGGRCQQGEVMHADGSCVLPEVTRDVYVFSIPETPRRPIRLPPRLPAPRVHEHVLFIRTPEGGNGPEPLLVPPPAQKSVVYVLRKESQSEEPRVIQAPAPPPARPEVFFVNYDEGDNPSLHGGLDLQHILQTGVTALPSQQVAATPSDLEETPEQKTYSTLGVQPNDHLVQEGHSDEGLAPGDYNNDGITLASHTDASPALGGQGEGNHVLGDHSNDRLANGDFRLGEHIDDDFSLEGHTDDTFVLGGHRDDTFVLGGHSDDTFVLGGHTDYISQGQELYTDDISLESHTDDISLESHTNHDFGLTGHNTGNLVLGSHPNNNGFQLGDQTNIPFSVQRDESPGYGLNNGVQETPAEAPTGFEFSNIGVLGRDHDQAGGNGGHAVPARLLVANLGGENGNFNGVNKEAAVQGNEGTVSADTVTRVNGNVYRPPTTPPTHPTLYYTQP